MPININSVLKLWQHVSNISKFLKADRVLNILKPLNNYYSRYDDDNLHYQSIIDSTTIQGYSLRKVVVQKNDAKSSIY